MAGPGTEPSTFGAWLRRHGALVALLRNTNYRRNLITLQLLNLRRVAGWRFFFALLFFPAVAAYLSLQFAANAQEGYQILQVVYGLVALGMGANFYSGDQQAGTFELQWLATGSEKSLLRFKALTDIIVLGLLTLPGVVVVAYLPGMEQLSVAGALGLLLTNAWFILAMMALAGTFFNQALSAGLLGLAVLGAWFLAFRGSTSLLYLFINPFPAGGETSALMKQGVEVSEVVINRVVLLGFAMLFFHNAARRLRRIF